MRGNAALWSSRTMPTSPKWLALRGAPPKIVWLRCGNQPTIEIARLLREHAGLLEDFDRDGVAACLELY